MKIPLPIQPNRTATLNALLQVEQCALAARWKRVLHHPMAYFHLWRTRLGKPANMRCNLFFGPSFKLALPAAADIYLCGGKTHDSEIRLARFLIQYLPQNAHVLDIGAHYGYFTLLMAHLACEGRVLGIEAAPSSMVYLKYNTETVSGIKTYSMALGESAGSMPFYTFPAQYSEYNTLDIGPYAGQVWFEKNPPEIHSISVNTLDAFCAEHAPGVSWIKMDVEGAEDRILQGGEALLSSNTVWMMEYLSTGNTLSYQRAEQRFREYGYSAYGIQADGSLTILNDVLAWMRQEQRDSENIVFIQSN
ncbi:MAG: FkbM family methyltransferase [Chitinophagaceae bacterium]